MMMRKVFTVFLAACFLFLCAYPGFAEDTALKSGTIFLCGEAHSDSACLEKELEALSLSPPPHSRQKWHLDIRQAPFIV